MTDKLPRVTATEVLKALERAGFFLARQSGSHKIDKNKGGKRGDCPLSCSKDYPSQGPAEYLEGCRSHCGKVQGVAEVNDNCRAIDLVLQKGHPGEVYNIGGNWEKSNIDVVNAFCSILEEKLALN